MPVSRAGSLLHLTIMCALLSAPLQTARAEQQLLARLDTVAESADRTRRLRAPRDPESLLSSLGELDQNISQAQTRIAALETQTSKDTTTLDAMRLEIDRGRKLSDDQQRAIHSHIRATWRLHDLVNRRVEHHRQSPTDWRRTKHYLAALDTHLERRRGQARLALVDVMSTVHEADDITRSLASQKQDLQREQRNLKHLLASRQPVLLQLESIKAQSGSQLITVYAEDADIKERLNLVDSSLADSQMPWPVAGAVHTRFGDNRVSKGQRWQGIHIGANAGDVVRAVSDGVVVFAGWMRGQGLLVVIDHGNGMMAVYGNNRRLLADVGDTVEAGSPIATIGATHREHAANLYFELRVEGKAVDPLDWLSPTPS